MPLCPKEQVLLAFFCGELGDPESTALELHIDECSGCRKVLAELARQSSFPVGGDPMGAAADAPEPERLGRYELRSVLGAGGMGIVYEAYDPEIDRTVAIKRVRRLGGRGPALAELQSRLEHEARAMAKVAHPNVVPIHDVGVLDGQLFIVMHHVAGRTLRQWLTEGRSRDAVLEAFLAAGEGLRAVHEAGLVHGDFKPDNVLVDAEGSVWLSDFGLSRLVTELVQPAAADETVASGASPATSGARYVVGTPGYLAPELREGGVPSVLSDQYAFCVSLYEALYGRRPPLASAMAGDRAPSAPWSASRLVRVLRKGLCPDPRGRFASMALLLDALERCTKKARRRRVMLWAGAALSVALLGGSARWLRDGESLCPPATAAWSGVWDESQRQQVTKVLSNSALSYAKTTVEQVTATLDRYRRDWLVVQREGCLAARVRKEQSKELYAARMECLEERRQQAQALVTLLAGGPVGDPGLVANATQAALSLPRVAECADPDALFARLVTASEPLSNELRALRQQLVRVAALRHVGRFKEGLAQAKSLQEEVMRHGGALRAEAEFELGSFLLVLGNQKESSAILEDSLWHALGNRKDRLAVEALVLLAYNSSQLGNYAAGLQLSERARGLLPRTGHAPEEELEVEQAVGVHLGFTKRIPAALACMERVWRILQKTFGEEGHQAARFHQFRGSILANSGHMTEALVDQRRAVAIKQRMLGTAHPYTVAARRDVGATLYELGRYQDALRELEPLVAADGSRDAPDHYVDPVLLYLSLSYAESGQYQKAEHTARRVLSLVEQRDGGSVRDLQARLALGEALRGQGRLEEAENVLRSYLGLVEKEEEPDEDALSMTLETLSGVLIDRGRTDEALKVALRALAIRERPHPGDVEIKSDLLIRISGLYAQQQDPETAARYLERAVSALTVEPHSARWARAAFKLARALPPGDRRACALVAQAEQQLVEAGEPDRVQLAKWREGACPVAK